MYLIEILHQTTTAAISFGSSVLLYLIEILHQTTTTPVASGDFSSCILSKFYIKPQHFDFEKRINYVVSYRNSTSNHNFIDALSARARLYLIEILHQTTTCVRVVIERRRLYLIEILHQTTTPLRSVFSLPCCILSKFYIKPQPFFRSRSRARCCILSKFYIKPQHRKV
mgnify:CR=1 FL=1